MKKRLLGATVLVSLAVIFIPMLFEKEPVDDSGISESNIPLPPEDRFSSRVLPLESEDLSRPPAQITPLNQSKEDGTGKILALKPEKRPEPVARAESVAPDASPELEPPVAGITPDASPEPEPQVAGVVPDRSAQTEPAVEPVVPDSSSAPKPPAKEDPAIKAEPPSEKTASAPSWVVQVGSFSNKINAEKIAGQLKKKGYPAFIEQADINGNSVYRVRVGPERSKSKAEQMLAKLDGELEAHKLKGSLKRYP